MHLNHPKAIKSSPIHTYLRDAHHIIHFTVQMGRFQVKHEGLSKGMDRRNSTASLQARANTDGLLALVGQARSICTKM